MKILYLTTIGRTMNFFKSFINDLIEAGHTVDIATNECNGNSEVPNCYREWGCKIYMVSYARNPLSPQNIKAIREIKDIIKKNNYDIVHCHTPVASVCTRVACRNYRKMGLRVIYTSHGFHFYKGGLLRNWILYYPIEKICSHWTDAMITINAEDYELAKKRFAIKHIIRIPGIGIDISKYNIEIDKNAYLQKIDLAGTVKIVLSVGEVNTNKNHSLVIRSIAYLKDSSIHYIVAGKGDQIESNIQLAEELGIKDQVHFLGYRNDIPELNQIADVFAFPSIREGLGLAAIEALASGTPVVGMATRGINEYVSNGITGYKFSNNIKSCAEAIQKCFDLIEKDEKLPIRCKEIASKYSYTVSNDRVLQLYRNVLDEN